MKIENTVELKSQFGVAGTSQLQDCWWPNLYWSDGCTDSSINYKWVADLRLHYVCKLAPPHLYYKER